MENYRYYIAGGLLPLHPYLPEKANLIEVDLLFPLFEISIIVTVYSRDDRSCRGSCRPTK